VQNLRLYIGVSGKKVWYVRYLSDGKEKTHKLGTAKLSVAQVHDAANDLPLHSFARRLNNTWMSRLSVCKDNEALEAGKDEFRN
jgi:hypothetical protein